MTLTWYSPKKGHKDFQEHGVIARWQERSTLHILNVEAPTREDCIRKLRERLPQDQNDILSQGEDLCG